MVKVELKGIILETYKENKGRWGAWFLLDLYDTKASRSIPEYFYTFASNDESLVEKEARKDAAIVGKSILMQAGLDIRSVSHGIESRYAALSFENWDDFYQKMNQNFVYED